MAEIKLAYNPFQLTSKIAIDGHTLDANHWLVQKTKGRRLQEYIGVFPEWLVKSENRRDFKITFHGFPLDYDDVKDAFNLAEQNGTINKPQMNFEKTDSDERKVYGEILQLFDDLQNGPFEDFKSEKLKKEFEDIKSDIFPVHVIATMSSGKSTLINALLGQKLMPASNEACTAITTEITDTDDICFHADVYDRANQQIASSKNLTYDEMKEWNGSDEVATVHVSGDIPFLGASETQLKMVDTPGPNNSRDKSHRETTYRNINKASNNLILYVLNYTQLQTNDDAGLIEYVAKQMNEQGKMSRDRFLFVINKMDTVTSDDCVQDAIQNVKDYLAKFGIDDPQLFPCSAATALGIRTMLKDIDPSKMTDDEKDELPSDVLEAYNRVRKLNRDENLYLEKYSTLSPSEQSKLNQELQMAIDNKDRNRQALIHSGIVSIEMAIKAYVTKYAKSKKIKDLTDTFRKKLNEKAANCNAAAQIATSEKEKEEFEKRRAAIMGMISKGNEAKKFKLTIDAINPIPALKKDMTVAKKDAMSQVTRFWAILDEEMTEEIAKQKMVQFKKTVADIIAELSVDLEEIINHTVVSVCNEAVEGYTKKLGKFDKSSKSSVSFGTEELVQSKLDEIRKMAKDFQSGSELSDMDKEALQQAVTEKNVQEVEYVKEKEKRNVKTGTKKVSQQVGTHKEKKLVGSHKETETRMVANPKKQGFFGKLKFWQDDEIEESYDAWYDDYEDVVVGDYKDVNVPVYEEKEFDVIREKKVEKVIRMVKKEELQMSVNADISKKIDAGIDGLIDDNKAMIGVLKNKFKKSFDEIDKEINDKYNELNEIAKGDEKARKTIKENKAKKNWIDDNLTDLDDILTV